MLTYNIHKCVGGLDRRLDPARIAETIAHYQPDIVLLQESAVPGPHEAGPPQVELLGDRLGYRHRAFFPHVIRRRGMRYGNALLSRYPITETRHIHLTIPPKKRRGALHAWIRLRAPSGRTRTLHIFNFHLGLSGLERKIQLRRFLAAHPMARLHHRAPVVIAGDFNDVYGTLGKKSLEPAGFRGLEKPLRTFPAIAPIRALDAVYTRGDIRILHAQRAHLAVARHASDHLPVIADLVFAESTA